MKRITLALLIVIGCVYAVYAGNSAITGLGEVSLSSANTWTGSNTFNSSIKSPMTVVVDGGNSTYSISTAQAQGGIYILNTYAGAKTYTLPSAAAGMAVCVKNGQGVAQILRIDTDGTDYIVMSTGARTSAAGDYYGATANAKNQICVVTFDTTDWYVIGEVGTWSEE